MIKTIYGNAQYYNTRVVKLIKKSYTPHLIFVERVVYTFLGSEIVKITLGFICNLIRFNKKY